MSISLQNNNQIIPILDGMRYYYNKTDECNFVPRMNITMTEPIDLPLLQLAAEKAMIRYRVFRLAIKRDDYQFFLVDNDTSPVIHIDDGTRHIIGSEENNSHIIWLGIDNKTIIFDFFHGISDGHGILPFIEYLLRSYCSLRYGTNIVPPPVDSLSNDTSEYIDPLYFIDEKKEYVQLKNTPPAFQLPEVHMDRFDTCGKYLLTVDADTFDNYMRQNQSSRTSVFTLFMNRAIAAIHPQYNLPIIAGVAVDVRKIYGADKTMRDCSDWLNICFDHDFESMPISEQLQLIRQMIIDGMKPDIRLANAAAIKRKNALIAEKFPLLNDKIRFCRRMYEYTKNSYTYNISCVGRVTFGPDVDAYVDCIEIGFNASTLPVSIVILQHKQVYRIVYCTHLKDDPYIHEFQKQFLQVGIPCTYMKCNDFVETLAIF